MFDLIECVLLMFLVKDLGETQQTFTCSKSTIETLENDVKYVQSEQ